ncbi:MAG: hypothetical protein Q9159_003721 [Coniocarpon cinnabarinum]
MAYDAHFPLYNPAFERFSAITELLEDALTLLPIRDILMSQRVCRRWFDTINNSGLILSRLWYRDEEAIPAVDEDVPDDYPHECTSTKYNPFVTRFGMSMTKRYLLCDSRPLRYLFGLPFPRCPFYDISGSWALMKFAHPVRRYLSLSYRHRGWVRWPTYYHYLIQCRHNRSLYFAEVLAVLAEIWDRQQRGIDRCRERIESGVATRAHNDRGRCKAHIQRRNGHSDMLHAIAMQDESADICVAVKQTDGQVDPAFSLRRSSGSSGVPASPSNGAAMRFTKIDYAMAFRWAGWRVMYRLNTGYEGSLIEHWRPFDPASPRRQRDKVENGTSALSDDDCASSILKTLTDVRVCGLAAPLARDCELLLAT